MTAHFSFFRPAVAAPPQSANRQQRWRPKLRSILFLLLIIGSLALIFNVDRTLTAEDREYIQLYLPHVPEGVAPSLTYADQIILIERAQRAVFERTTGWVGIPEGQPREPKELYLSRSGMCYDRSRVLEKIFVYLGFPTRHLSLFTREANVAAWITLLFHHVPSHAISEVLTKKGWLMVDSNTLWVSLDAKFNPVSVPELQRRGLFTKWYKPIINKDRQIYNTNFILVYGLYSRHGRFYPPFIPGIPDFRIRGLLYNFDQLWN